MPPTKHTTLRLSEEGKARLLRLSTDSQAETIEEALVLLEAHRAAWWGGKIGQEARATLSTMALEDAVKAGTEQNIAAECLIARLILEERDRRLSV